MALKVSTFFYGCQNCCEVHTKVSRHLNSKVCRTWCFRLGFFHNYQNSSILLSDTYSHVCQGQLIWQLCYILGLSIWCPNHYTFSAKLYSGHPIFWSCCIWVGTWQKDFFSSNQWCMICRTFYHNCGTPKVREQSNCR